MIALVQTVAGAFAVDLDTDEVEPWNGSVPVEHAPALNLPRVVSASAAGSAIFAVVATTPPIVVSHDAGVTWRESGRGLPPGVAVSVLADNPDVAVYAARNRLYLTRDGGVLWTALALELPKIAVVHITNHALATGE
jgi:photosystem II stability/assembly factor-like uncharacterized protein